MQNPSAPASWSHLSICQQHHPSPTSRPQARNRQFQAHLARIAIAIEQMGRSTSACLQASTHSTAAKTLILSLLRSTGRIASAPIFNTCSNTSQSSLRASRTSRVHLHTASSLHYSAAQELAQQQGNRLVATHVFAVAFFGRCPIFGLLAPER